MAIKTLSKHQERVLDLYLVFAGINRKINQGIKAGTDWDELLDGDEQALIGVLRDVMAWSLQEYEDEGEQFVTRSMLEESDAVKRLRVHRHECGQRMTGGAVVVEVS